MRMLMLSAKKTVCNASLNSVYFMRLLAALWWWFLYIVPVTVNSSPSSSDIWTLS